MSSESTDSGIESEPDWQLVDPSWRALAEPQLTVMVNGELYINKRAEARFFAGYEYAYLHVDQGLGLLGIDPVHSEDQQTVKIVRDDTGGGGSMSIKSALYRLGIDPEEIDESFHAAPQEIDGVVAIDVSGLVPGLSQSTPDQPEASTAEPADTTTPDGADDESAETATEESQPTETNPIDSISSDDRQRLAEQVDAALDETRIIEASSSELGDELGLELSAQGIAQNLRILREDDREYPFDIEYVDADQAEESFWRLRATDDRDYSDGQTHSYNVDEDDPEDADLQDRVSAAIDSGTTDVHELAVELDLSTDVVRSVARELDLYGDLHDAAEGGGYGRPGDD